MTPDLYPFARFLASWIVYAVVDGVMLAFAGWLLVKLFRGQSSGRRFAALYVLFLLMLVLPLAGSLRHTGAWSSPGGAVGPAPLVVLSDAWAFGIAGVWALLTMAALLPVLLSMWQLRRVRRSGRAITLQEISPLLAGLKQQFEQPRRVSLMVSETAQVPAAVGFFKPAIMIPEWLAREASPQEIRHVLLHELSHLRRRDDWSNLLQKIVKAFVYFHPAAWWMENRLMLEREMACDEMVIADDKDARSYCESLAHLARKSAARRQATLAQAAVGKVHHLSLRVAQMLRAPAGRAARTWKPALGLLAMASASGAFVSWHGPALVSFEAPVLPAAVSTAGNDTGAMTAPRIAAESDAEVKMTPAALKAAPQKTIFKQRDSRPRTAMAKRVERQPRPILVTVTSERVQTDGFSVWSVRYSATYLLTPVDPQQQKQASKKAT